MPITLTKTLQSEEYNLYLIIEPIAIVGSRFIVAVNGYRSQGHYQDNFTPLIVKRETIDSQTLVLAYRALAPFNMVAAVQAIESYMVQSIAYYLGGSVS